MKKQLSILILIVFLIACKANNLTIRENTTAILHTILKENKTACLDKKTVDEHDSSPKEIIEHLSHYFKLLKETNTPDPFFINNDQVIDEKLLKQLNKQTFTWQKKEWTQKEVLPFKNLQHLKIGNKDACNHSYNIRISEPIYSKNRKKALVLFTKSKSGIGSTTILFLKKENNEWLIKGQAPIGTIG